MYKLIIKASNYFEGYNDIVKESDDIEEIMEIVKQQVGYELVKMHGHYNEAIITDEYNDIIFKAQF